MFSKGTCKGCIVGKHAEHKYDKGKERRVVQVLELINSDLIGTLPTPSYGNLRYFLTFINDFLNIVGCSSSSKNIKCMISSIFFKYYVQNFSGKKIKALRTDNGKEYVNKNLQ